MAHANNSSHRTLPAFIAAGLLLSTSAPALAQSLPQTAPTQDAAPAAQPAVTPTPATPPAAAAPSDAAPSATPMPDAAPTAATPPAMTAPAMTAPAAQTPTVTSNPIVQAVPDSSQPAAATAPQTETAAQTPATPRTPARSTPAPRAVGGIPAARAAERPVAAPVASPAAKTPASDTASVPARRDPAGLYTADGTAVSAAKTTVVTQQSPYARYWPLEAAGAIVLIGLVGYAFTRRREEDDEEFTTVTTTEAPIAPAPAATPAFAETPAMPVIATAAPVMAQPLAQAHSATLDVEEAPSVSALPAGPVPSGAAREALLQRMVEAAPDEANPFHTVKARMRRARMILSARKQALHEQATEAFDWRTYRPSLTHTTLGTTPGSDATVASATKREPVK